MEAKVCAYTNPPKMFSWTDSFIVVTAIGLLAPSQRYSMIEEEDV